MKARWLFGLSVLALAFGSQVSAGPMITIDENGNGFVQDGATITALIASLAPDPGPGGLPSVLTYSGLPFLGQPGDVFLTDAGVFLDVIRFNGNSTIVFYSDNLGGADALADTDKPPSSFYTNQISISEIGVEGDNGAIYTPVGRFQPGSDPSGPVYHFVSDGSAVPEPASLALLGVGTFSLLGYRLRKRLAM